MRKSTQIQLSHEHLRWLDALADLAIILGSIGSEALTLYAGRHNRSVLLVLAFGLWVLVPFAVATALARTDSGRLASRRIALDVLTLIIAACSLGIYARVVFGSARPRMAAPFLITPAACLMALSGLVILGRFAQRAERRTV